ncbi:hypothetical protein [Nocardia bhagyanarayanae]|uniref:hypothetical protein n=1 Tax=Nocardia bhagyanarayanae TaxID=1215925 RepID=UPI00114F7D81|nr:hypothetical protein [Nocardia bhagyanarayanae]
MSAPVDLDHLDQHPADPDLPLIGELSDPRLSRLVRTSFGLSAESIDLLTSLAERLRTAERALPDPAYL